MITWRWLYATLVIVGLKGLQINGEEDTPSPTGNVIELTSSNFEHLTQASTGQTTGKWIIKFYAPWCGHCQMLEPKWNELSTTMSINYADEGVLVARIDASKHRDVGTRFGIKGFPTLIYLAERKMYLYKGGRDVDSLVDFVTKGYKTAEGKDVPPMPTFYDKFMKEVTKLFDKTQQNEHLRMLTEDFTHILDLRKNAAVALLALGACFGLVFGCIVGSLRQRKVKKVKKD